MYIVTLLLAWLVATSEETVPRLAPTRSVKGARCVVAVKHTRPVCVSDWHMRQKQSHQKGFNPQLLTGGLNRKKR